MTLTIFRTEGNCPVKKDIKNIINCWEMSFFKSSKIFTGMVFGTDDLWESSEDIIFYFCQLELRRTRLYLY